MRMRTPIKEHILQRIDNLIGIKIRIKHNMCKKYHECVAVRVVADFLIYHKHALDRFSRDPLVLYVNYLVYGMPPSLHTNAST